MPRYDIAAKNTPFAEAIDFFRRKISLPTKSYRDLAGECHAKAFMIAGATNDAMLADFHKTILKYMEIGKSANDFRADFERIAASFGWTGYTGENNPGWRSAIIIDTNIRTSYMAGRWQKLSAEKEARPYLMYQQVQRPSKRPEHAQWHGLIYPIDHEFWNTHYPPNGWNCLCTAIGVSAGQMRREGLSLGSEEDARQVDVSPEWAYNVGKAGRVSTEEEKAEWVPLITSRNFATYRRPEAVPLDKPRAQIGEKVNSDKEMLEAVRSMLDGTSGKFQGPDGLIVGITLSNFAEHLKYDRAPIVPLVPEMIEDPFEIWLMPYRDKLTGRVELRRRYIKALDIGKGVFGLFVAEFRKGELGSVTVIDIDRKSRLQRQRAGVLVWGRK